MTSLQVAEKKEKSLTEILIVVVLIAILMASFIFYFFKHQGQLTQAGFASLAQVFSARVTGIHGQWFMDQKPHFVNVKSSQIQADGSMNVKIPVNSAGWVDAGNKALSCQNIWQFVMETPLIYMKQPVGAVLVDQGSSVLAYCQYSLPSGEYFTYQRHSGKVSTVKLTHE